MFVFVISLALSLFSSICFFKKLCNLHMLDHLRKKGLFKSELIAVFLLLNSETKMSFYVL